VTKRRVSHPLLMNSHLTLERIFVAINQRIAIQLMTK